MNSPSSSQGACWGDYDADGWIDLFVANTGLDFEHPEMNFLYHNRGDGTMEPVPALFTETRNPNHGGIWTDFDGDGDLDLALAGQNPVLFRNQGPGAFAGFYPEEGGIPEHTEDTDIVFASADYDNDGDIDLVYVIWRPDSGVQLFRNDQKKLFRDVSHVLPPEDRLRAMSVAWGDYDNDGYQDMLIANFIGENRLYHNDGGASFSRITGSPVEHSGNNSAGCAWVDYDNDGDLDAFVSNGLWSTFGQSCELFRNEGTPNNWIVVKLTGTVSNRFAIGAKVWAQITLGGIPRMLLREVQSGGHAQNATDQRVHFGLGDAEVIELLRIEWPSGQVQELHNVTANRFLTIAESVPESPQSGS